MNDLITIASLVSVGQLLIATAVYFGGKRMGLWTAREKQLDGYAKLLANSDAGLARIEELQVKVEAASKEAHDARRAAQASQFAAEETGRNLAEFRDEVREAAQLQIHASTLVMSAFNRVMEVGIALSEEEEKAIKTLIEVAQQLYNRSQPPQPAVILDGPPPTKELNPLALPRGPARVTRQNNSKRIETGGVKDEDIDDAHG